jgi:prevent-host-death family protein
MTRFGYDQVMKTVQISHLKAHLSEHLRDVRAGETLTVLDRATPVAQIVPLRGGGKRLAVRPARVAFGRVARPTATDVSSQALAEALAAERQTAR